MANLPRTQPDSHDEVVFIDGQAVDGTYSITIDNQIDTDYGDSITPPQTILGSVEISTAVDWATYEKYVGPTGEASMSMIRGGPRAQEPRCLWGRRKGYVQVGSMRDIYGDYLKIDVPRVRFSVDRP